MTDIKKIKRIIRLKPIGKNMKGKCPFCREDNLLVRPKASKWHCFNCKRGGELSELVKKL